MPGVPAGLRRATKAKLGSIPQGATITGAPTLRKAGREVLQETITVAHKKHSIFPLRGNLLYKSKGVTNSCELCGLKLKEDSTSVLFDGKTPAHSYCVLDQALQESCGDIHAAEACYELPFGALYKRAQKLLKEGKLTEIIV